MIETNPDSTILKSGGVISAESELQPSLGRMMISSAFVALLILTMIYIAAVVSFGGLSAAVSWVNGSPIHIEQKLSVVNVKSGDSVTIPIAVRRLAPKPVTIVGATTGCGCVTISGLPLTMTDTVHDLRVEYKAASTTLPEIDQQQVQLHLSVDSPPVVLNIEAHISP